MNLLLYACLGLAQYCRLPFRLPCAVTLVCAGVHGVAHAAQDTAPYDTFCIHVCQTVMSFMLARFSLQVMADAAGIV